MTALALGWRAAPFGTAALFGVTVVLGLLPGLSAWTGKLLFDELALGRHADAGRATMLAVAAALAAFGLVALELASGLTVRYVQRAVSLRVQDVLYRHVNGFPGLRYFEDPVFQDRLRLAEQGAQSAPQGMTDLLTGTVRSGVAIAGFVGAVLVVWPPMVPLLGLAAVPAYLGQRSMGRRHVLVMEQNTETLRKRYFYQQLLTDPATAKEVRLYGLGPLFHGRMLNALRTTSGADLAVEQRGAVVQGWLALLTAGVSVVGAVVVVRGVAGGHLSVGDAALFTAAVAGVQTAVAATVAQLARSGQNLRLFRHFLAVIDAPADITGGDTPVSPLRTGIELRDIWFRYDSDGPWILRGLDLVIPHGCAVGLVGLNGAGKSTLVKLLCRFYEPERGQILWDGTDVRQLAVDDLRRRIAATFQDYSRYDVTAAENVGIGDVERLDDLPAVRRAATAAGIDRTLSTLRQGYQTLLSRVFLDADRERGLALSGGQWQRVALARSLMRDHADLLILDEPSSGLDAAAEHEIHQTLARRRAGHTSLLISHRLNTLRDADVLAVLADGEITERGTHEQLMAANGQYAQLFRLQAEGYQEHPVGADA
ncbi:MAG: ABC transporter ATP-binding protein [Catenulispora sp.]|nr:ABC transporter ATP-binding protein [Catenulispora sp.]